MREKLIELLSEDVVEFCNVDIIAGHCKIRAITFNVDNFADHLIANGVTIPVRCKDCEKWQRHTHVDRERGHCRRFNMTKHESGFCDRGERRTE